MGWLRTYIGGGARHGGNLLSHKRRERSRPSGVNSCRATEIRGGLCRACHATVSGGSPNPHDRDGGADLGVGGAGTVVRGSPDG
ncbi:hypothetical protein SBD_7150 [Streptomyces bottropensis ATCC 25435]|uniref:Uncharacterized protein n=1 Tax=Streptomyces bottropensis ATCC 25435 TaxID=1054862 RepID=M3E5W4_9ACTN|nr:hypothetical protein SBD_7150 [Streptomyces bottropensis ATCC 25435]